MNLAYSNVTPLRPDRRAADVPEATGKGFALLHRKIMELPFYRTDSDAVHLWIHFILSANHSPSSVSTEFGEFMCRRGEFITGRHSLAKETGIDPNRIKYLIQKFEKLGMISKVSTKKFSRILVTKYDDYQQKIVPTDCHQSAIANPRATRASEEVVPTDCHQSATNNNILNTNVFNDRQRIQSPPPKKEKSQRPESAIQSPKGDKWGTADDLKAAEWIYSQVSEVKPSAKKPSMAAWANDIRLMRQSDGRTHKEICTLFKWANSDGFWYSNILSPAKLRAKWDTLALQQSQKSRQRRDGAEPSPHWNSPESWEEFL